MGDAWNRQEIYRKAEEYRAARKYRKAINEYKKILEVDPDDYVVHGKLAEVYHFSGEAREAVPHFEKVAAGHYKDRRIDRVIAIRKQLVDIDSRNLARYFDLGVLMVEKHLDADAVALYQTALAIFKGRSHDPQQLQLYQAILKLKENEHAARFALAKLYRRHRKDDAAETLLLDGLAMMHDKSLSRWQKKFRWQLFWIQPTWKRFIKIWKG